MKKYEAPIAELELFVVEDVMAGYDAEETTEDPNAGLGTNDLPIS